MFQLFNASLKGEARAFLFHGDEEGQLGRALSKLV